MTFIYKDNFKSRIFEEKYTPCPGSFKILSNFLSFLKSHHVFWDIIFFLFFGTSFFLFFWDIIFFYFLGHHFFLFFDLPDTGEVFKAFNPININSRSQLENKPIARVKNAFTLFFTGIITRVYNRNSVARNCDKFQATVRGIARNYAQFLGVYRARNCAQVKFTCVETLISTLFNGIST